MLTFFIGLYCFPIVVAVILALIDLFEYGNQNECGWLVAGSFIWPVFLIAAAFED